MGNRCSSLPIAQFCAMAPKLQAKAGAGRSAFMGRAFHARCSEEPGWETLWHRLTPEEQEEVSEWKRPADIVLEPEGWAGAPVVLRYDQAEKEVAVGLTADGRCVEYGHPDAVTSGTCDLFWIVLVEQEDGSTLRIAYVPDIKRSEYTVAEGADSLQILAYAFAISARHDCDGFVAGIWAAVEGTWSWGDLLLWDRDTERMLELLQRVVAAATNTDDGDYCVGNHCRGCYGRSHCPAWILPPELAETSLAPLTEPGAIMGRDQARELLLLSKRAKDTAELAEKHLRQWVRDHGPIFDPATEKEWKPIGTKGRDGFDKDRLQKEKPEVFQEYFIPGRPTDSFRWVYPEGHQKKRKKKKSETLEAEDVQQILEEETP